jgi:hypothetical protein
MLAQLAHRMNVHEYMGLRIASKLRVTVQNTHYDHNKLIL